MSSPAPNNPDLSICIVAEWPSRDKNDGLALTPVSNMQVHSWLNFEKLSLAHEDLLSGKKFAVDLWLGSGNGGAGSSGLRGKGHWSMFI